MEGFRNYIIPARSHPLPHLPPNEGSVCIYCPNPLSNRSKEHIFNSSFGGRISPRDIDCHKCNEYFSDSIDVAFDDLLLKIKNVRALVTERHKVAPNIMLDDGSILAPYGMPIFSENVVLQIQEHNDNTFSFRIDGVDSITKAKKVITDFDLIEQHLGHPLKKEQKDFLQNVTEIKIERESVIKEFHWSHTVESNLQLQYRCVANTLLKALSHFQPEVVRNEIFDVVRKYVRYGEGSWQDFAVHTVENPRFLPSRIQFYQNTFNHVMIYFSERMNKVIGVFTMLGMIKRSVVLANEWRATEALMIIDEDCLKNPPEIRCRYYEFLVDSGLPSIMSIPGTTLDEKYYYDELVKLEKEILALGPAYMFGDYLKDIEKSGVPFSEKILNELHQMVVKQVSTALRNFDGEFIPDEEVMAALREVDFENFKIDFIGKFPNAEFHKRLQTISKESMLKLKPEIKFIEPLD